MRGRPASPASCTARAPRPDCRRRACGPRCRTTSPRLPTRRRRWRSSASSRGSWAYPSTPPTSRAGPLSTSVRSTSPCRATPTSRPSSSVWRRPPTTTGQPSIRETFPAATRSRGSFSVSCASAAARAARNRAEDERLLLGGRADDPEVAGRARRVRRRRLKPLRQDPVRYLEHGLGDPVAVGLVALDRDLLVVQHVVVRLLRGVELPRLPGADRVQGQLHVLAQLRRSLRPARLVVDQLVAAIGQPVDAIDPAAQQVRPQPEGERALEPQRLGRLALEALEVPRERAVGLPV